MDPDERIKQLEDRVRELENYLTGPVLGGTAQKLVGSSLEIADEQGRVVAALKPMPGGATLIIGDVQARGAVIVGRGEDGPHVMLTRRDQKCAAMLTTDKDDLPQLLFAGEQAKPQITLGPSKQGAEFCLRDAAGKARLTLGVMKNGTPNIALYDAKGEIRVMLDAIDGGSTALNLYDANGKTCAQLIIRPDGVPMLLLQSGKEQRAVALVVDKDNHGMRLFDAEGHARLLISAHQDGSSNIAMTSADDKMRVLLGVDDQQSGLRLYDSHEQGRLVISVDADEQPWITVHDAEQKRRAKLTLMRDGTALFSVNDSDGRPRATLSAHPKGGGLIVSDDRGKTRAMLCLLEEGPKLIMLDEDGEPIHEVP